MTMEEASLDPPPRLTPKQKAFIDAYVGEARGNATKAARIAGYADPEVSGWQNKQKAVVADAIREILAERTLKSEQVLDLLTQHANADLSPFLIAYGPDEFAVDLSTPLAKANIHLLKSVKKKTKSGGSGEKAWRESEIEIVLHDPQAAAVHLGRYHKLFTDKADITSAGQPITLSDEERATRAMALLDAARARRDGSTPDGGQS